ncbi:MAG: sodium-dependent transporter [Succinivibrio sp.]|nr:sodium-dependent transporter [Succinivibrio sp.]
MNASRVGFATTLGGILASAGSAIGLGNIWRFPMQAGQNGGSAFIIVYLLCILVFGIPLMIAEFAVGRKTRANVGNAFKVLSPDSPWRFVGPLAVIIAFLILCYYNVVAGWVLCYTYDAIIGTFQVASATTAEGGNVYADLFVSFISNPWKPVVCLILFMAATHYVVTRGVDKGIERFSKMLMPLLFLLLVLLVIFALNMPGASQGLEFLFKPNFDAITPSVVLSALAQCFYSMSLGMGLVTYASYFKRDANLSRSAVSIAIMDTLVAIAAGVVIFPAVFSVEGVEPTAGASLVFIALPNVFNSALSASPLLAWIIPVMFFFLLMVATITSCIFLHEVATAFVAENTNLTRHRSALVVSVLAIAIGICCSLSMGPWSDFTLFDMNLFDLFDYVTAKLMLPISGFFIALFVGWKLNQKTLQNELTSNGLFKCSWLQLFLIDMKVVIPAIIVAIMVAQLMGTV